MRYLLSAVLAVFPYTLLAQLPPEVADVPTSAPREFQQEYSKLLPEGPRLVTELVPHLKEVKDEADAKARFVISGLVWQTGKSGTPEQKKALGKALLENVPKADGDLPKVFLLEQLQYISDPAFADGIAGYLKEEALANQALRTLLVTNPDGLEKMLINALPAAPERTQTGILLALSKRRPGGGAGEIAKFLENQNQETRAAAVRALAASGDPASADQLKAALSKADGYYGVLAPAVQLVYARALAANNHASEAAAVYREILAAPDAHESAHLKSAALYDLARLEGDKALPDLLKAAESDHEEIRVPALRLAAGVGTSVAAGQLVAKMESTTEPEIAADLVLALGRVKDPAAKTAVFQAMESEDVKIRSAAVKAAGLNNRTEALPLYASVLQNADTQVAAAVAEQLARADEAALRKMVSDTLESASPAGKAMLIDQIVRRRFSDLREKVFALTKSEDAQVRTAAYKGLESLSEPGDLQRLLDMMLKAKRSADRNAARRAFVATARELPEEKKRTKLLLGRFKSAAPQEKVLLLETFPALGGKESLKVVVDQINSESTELKDAAVRALSEWPDPAAAAELKKLLTPTADQKHQVLAIRGLVRLASETKDEAKKLNLLKSALEAAKRPDELKLVVSGLGEVQMEEALKLVMPFLEQPELQGEASAAVAKIVLPRRKNEKGLESGPVAVALIKAIPHLSEPEMKKRAEDHLKQLQN